MRVEESKRASSPRIESKPESLMQEQIKKSAQKHKRVKSDVPENPKKKQLNINLSLGPAKKMTLNKKASHQSSSSNIVSS